ncbi:MAG: glycosyltransferase family 39 protein [Bacillales bacterium]|nr:glycosyltransferase family 39 protein [Bacillales bacterium]
MKLKGRIDFLLLGILLLSIFLNFYRLKDAGSNTYYTVAVKSMLTSFHTFFYASFDPAGFITVDKPPVALWIQALSAYLFGLSDFSVLLPEALAGVISVWLMYVIIKPQFGRKAALLSSLVLACTPIFVAVVATWFLMKAVEKQKIRWLLWSFFLVGIGFNIKMLQAYMVLPAFYLFYFIAAKSKWTKRMVQLIAATVVLLVVSLSWAAIVDMVPKDERPYIGSSQTNSVLELALGYNGISRLTGMEHGNGRAFKGMPNMEQNQKQFENGNGSSSQGMTYGTRTLGNGGFPSSFGQDGGKRLTGNGGMGRGMFGTGNPGVTRLFSKQLAGQISWLLPFVLFSVIGLIVSYRKTREFTMQHKFAIFWLAWLIPMMIFFSIAGFFHQYYLSMMGPAIAGLVGMGWIILWNFYKEKQGWPSWLLPAAILATAFFETLILFQNREVVSETWMAFTAIVGVILFVFLTIMQNREKAAYFLSVAGMLAVLILPFYWGLTTVLHGGNSTIPVAGPTSQSFGLMMDEKSNSAQPGGAPGGMFHSGQRGGKPSGQTDFRQRGGMMEEESNTKLLSYLEKHYHGEKFMLAVDRATTAAPFMLKTNYAVMAMGGFSGSDPVLTPQKLEKMAKAGDVKYFLISSGMGMGSDQKINEWIGKNCKEVPSSEWESTKNSDNNQLFRRDQNMKLYVYKG